MKHGDLPLEDLKKYMGCSPCPSDFDEFWDEALLEMRSINPCFELIPSKFQVPFAECFDLYFTGVRGARIHAKYLKPKNAAEPHPAVLKFHGYAWNAGEWNDKLAYVAMGYSVASLDCRGQGGKSEDTGGVKGPTLRGHVIRGLEDSPENMIFRHIFLDTAQLASIVMNFPEVDERRVCATGDSQGGGLTLACAALEPRIWKLAPVHPFLSDIKKYWEMDTLDELKEYFRFFDPRHEKEEEVFLRLGYIDVQNLAKRIRGEVLMATGMMDAVCPPSTQFASFNKITSPKKMLLYPDFGHEFYPDLFDSIFEFFTSK
ncbi:MAG: acetylxylan esterase [Clostridia bacterium]|nr:acetylxylan esterase [Clostridia bacterium]